MTSESSTSAKRCFMDASTGASAMYFVIDCFLSNSSALILANSSFSSLKGKKTSRLVAQLIIS